MVKRLLPLVLVGVAQLALADPPDNLDPAGLASQCPPLLTEAECRAHHRILAVLADPQERNAYLNMHMQLLEERRALCGCSQAMNSVGMLHQP